jgi:hypothetical protein
LVPMISAVSPWNLGTSQSLDVSPILFAETTRNEEAMEGYEQGEEEEEGEGDTARLPVSAIRMQAHAPNNSARVVSTVFSRLAQPKARDGNVRKCVTLCVSLCVCVYISDIYTHAFATHACSYTEARRSLMPESRTTGVPDVGQGPGAHLPHLYSRMCMHKSKAVTKATAPCESALLHSTCILTHRYTQTR